jgi:hypothetical protein
MTPFHFHDKDIHVSHVLPRSQTTHRGISIEIEIEIEIVYNNTTINRLLSLGPPCYAKLGLISVG